MTDRSFSVTAFGQSLDIRWDGFEARRKDLAGLGWTFSSRIDAPDAETAEKIFRKGKLFRKVVRQNSEDWRTVGVVVERMGALEFAITDGHGA